MFCMEAIRRRGTVGKVASLNLTMTPSGAIIGVTLRNNNRDLNNNIGIIM